MTPSLPAVRVSRKGEERLRSGHPWVFGDDLREVPEGMPPGQWVRVFSRAGDFLGTATANLGARLALRRVSRAEVEPSPAFFESRIRDRLAELRTRDRDSDAPSGGNRSG